jgi:uncharacterized protein
MEIKHKEVGSKGMFYIEHEGKTAAKMTYSIAGEDLIIIDHTEVDEVLKGKSAGAQMLGAAVAFARENNIKIIPLCPFAKSMFDKKTEYSDVLSS